MMKPQNNLPKACIPKYGKTLEEHGLICFRTRKDAVYHAWYVMNRNDVNLFKEGPYYTCRIGDKLYQTGWRNLGFSVDQFEDCINNQYFPF